MPPARGFFTDTSVGIGCKACEVACKEWNQLPAAHGGAGTLSGDSYDNTRRLDGADEKMLGGLNAFFLLVDKPEVYGLPPDPKIPTRNLGPGSLWSVLGAVVIGLLGAFNLRSRRVRSEARPEREAA